MQVHIAFTNAKVYNIDRDVDIVVGQTFTLFTDAGIPIKFFSDNDRILNLTDAGVNADGVAAETGKSIILIMDSNFGIIKQIHINVVDAIIPPASSLNVTFGPEEIK